jgi:hypothetical protein
MRRIKFDIDENDKITGVKTMSIVDEPAIGSDFIAFSQEKPEFVELKNSNYKHVVAGLALIPDKDILRTLPNGEQYFAYFTKDSVERIRNKFHKQQMTDRVNVDHKQDKYINAFLIESFIIDSAEREADVRARGISHGVMGSWFVAYKVEDEETFNRVLSGELRGFSIEIFVNKFFSAEKPEKKEDPEVKLKSKKHFERRLAIRKIQNTI